MATLIYNTNKLSTGTITLCRDEVVKETSNYAEFESVNRDGYMRKSIPCLLFFHYQPITKIYNPIANKK